MTQSQEIQGEVGAPAAKVPAEPATFNLIITTSHPQANKIAHHFGLECVRSLDTFHHLPSGGPMRGEVLNRILGESGDDIVTVVVLQDDAWVKVLLQDMQGMAPKVWRAIESKLLGHRTDQQRNLLIVASEFAGGCREAETAGQLRHWVRGSKIPANWKAPRPATEKTAKGQGPKTGQKKSEVPNELRKEIENAGTVNPFQQPPASPRNQMMEPQRQDGKKIKNASLSGVVGNPEGFKTFQGKGEKGKAKTDFPTPPRSGPGPTRRLRLNEDLYLLAKGHYGIIADGEFRRKASILIMHHMNIGRVVSDELLVSHLFKTLVGMSGRGYWGGFNLLQEVINAGARGPSRVIEVLTEWISAIPTRGPDNKEVKQPTVLSSVFHKLNIVAETTTVPEGMLVTGSDGAPAVCKTGLETEDAPARPQIDS